jgi:hypothetical protein
MRRARPTEPEQEPPLLTRAEARRFFRVTNATLDRWVQRGRLKEALRVPSAPPRRRAPLVLFSICDGTLRTRLARRLQDSPGEVLAVQLLPETVRVEASRPRAAQPPRAHQRRAHPGRTGILELQGVFHRQPARAEPDVAAVEQPAGGAAAAVATIGAGAAAGANAPAAELVAGAEPAALPPADAMPMDLPPMPQPADVGQRPVPSGSVVEAPAARAADDAAEPDAAPPPAFAATPATAAPAPPPAIATLMASDAELAMLFGDQAQAPGPGAPAPGDAADPARPASGAEVLRSLTEQIAGLRSEILWDDRQVSGERSGPRSRASQAPAPAPLATETRAPLASPSLVAAAIALLLLWPCVLWLRSGDLFWALAALVFANLAGCTALLCARPPRA